MDGKKINKKIIIGVLSVFLVAVLLVTGFAVMRNVGKDVPVYGTIENEQESTSSTTTTTTTEVSETTTESTTATTATTESTTKKQETTTKANKVQPIIRVPAEGRSEEHTSELQSR